MSGTYTGEELKDLELARELRLKMLNKNFEADDVPRSVGEQRINNELISGLEDGIYKQAKLRLASDTNEKDAKMTELALGILNQIDTHEERKRDVGVGLSDSFIPNNIVPGETDINPSSLTLKELGMEEL